MRKIRAKKLIWFGGLVLILIALALFELETPYLRSLVLSGQAHVVKLTDSGFEPKEITIRTGDEVRFVNTRSEPFWPASNLHSTHTIYPEFDPKKPIPAGSDWSFRFTKSGSWRYHDHLASLFTGIIIVEDSDTAGISDEEKKKIEDCRGDEGAKLQCWQEVLKDILIKGGLGNAYDAYAKLYLEEPDFAENCHDFTHILGETGYEKFAKDKKFPVTTQVAYCSYGFFHGFIEAMMQKGGDLSQAREMCAYVDKQLAGQTETLGACLHGIGHGVTDGSDPRTYGNVFAIIDPGLQLCEKIAQTPWETKLCATGVFNALAGMYLNPKYGLKLDRDDPFWICRQQKSSDIRHACHDDFKALIFTLADNDFPKAIRYVEEINEDTFAYDAMDNLATYYVYFLLKIPDLKEVIDTCHSIQPRISTACIRGIGAGLMTAGAPDEEYVRAIEFCKNPLLSEQESEGCFERVLWLTSLRYTAEKHREICETVEVKYRAHCPTG